MKHSVFLCYYVLIVVLSSIQTTVDLLLPCPVLRAKVGNTLWGPGYGGTGDSHAPTPSTELAWPCWKAEQTEVQRNRTSVCLTQLTVLLGVHATQVIPKKQKVRGTKGFNAASFKWQENENILNDGILYINDMCNYGQMEMLEEWWDILMTLFKIVFILRLPWWQNCLFKGHHETHENQDFLI